MIIQVKGVDGMKRILVVEDEHFIRDILTYALRKEEYHVLEASNGAEARSIMEDECFDLALLDVMLPDTDGFELCKEITNKNLAPVIMLTAKNDITDKLAGLGLGAEDYITKPFDIREVLARIQIVLRRSKAMIMHQGEGLSINQRMTIMKDSHEVIMDNKRIPLKRKEFQLLLTLAENSNRVLSRDQLLQLVWGYDFEGDSRTVDVHIQRLRKKLGETKDNSVIETVFGVGYKLVESR